MEVRSIEAIVSALNSAEVRYLIVGGLAVNAYGYERLTRDVDLVIGLQPGNIVRGLRTLEGVGYRMSIPVTAEQFAEPERRDHWRKEKGIVVLRLWSDFHRRTPIAVFVYEPFAFDREYAAARWEPVTGQIKAPIVQYQTLLEMKRLEAARRTPPTLQNLNNCKSSRRIKTDDEGGALRPPRLAMVHLRGGPQSTPSYRLADDVPGETRVA